MVKSKQNKASKEPKIPKNPKSEKDKANASNSFSNISALEIPRIVTDYHIDARFELRLPGETDTILTAPEGFEPTYLHHFWGGLRVPIDPFVVAVLRSYALHLAQLVPNALRKVIGFVMASRSVGIEPSVKIFRHFYTISARGDWAIFALRPGHEPCIDGLKDSIKE